MRFVCLRTSHVTTARCGCFVRPTSGQMHIDSGRVPILTSNLAKSTVRHARVMASMLRQSASAIRTSTERGVNIWTSAQSIRIVVCRASVSTSVDLLCHVNNATASLDGLDRDATKVCALFIVLRVYDINFHSHFQSRPSSRPTSIFRSTQRKPSRPTSKSTGEF